MDVLNLRVQYRPLRIGFCIGESDFTGFRNAVRFATTLWGGRYNPILPVSDDARVPLDMAAAFRLDCLYPVSDLPTVSAFVDSLQYLRWPDYERALFVRREGGPAATVLDVYHPARHLASQMAQSGTRPRPTLFDWSEDDPLSDFFLATCGA